MPRIRHCAECPKCGTRYLIASSPYHNGSYLLPTVAGGGDEYILYCCCRQLPVSSRWKAGELKACEISKPAYDRGYGTAEEMPLVHSGTRARMAVRRFPLSAQLEVDRESQKSAIRRG